MILVFDSPPNNQILINPKTEEYMDWFEFIMTYIGNTNLGDYSVVDMDSEEGLVYLVADNTMDSFIQSDLKPFKPLAPYNRSAIIFSIIEHEESAKVHTGSVNRKIHCSKKYQGAENARGYDIANKIEQDYEIPINWDWDQFRVDEIACNM